MNHTLQIRSGQTRVPIFRSSVRTRGHVHRSYVIRWTDLNGQRHERRRAQLAAARAEAQRIADDLAAGRPQCALSAAEIADYNAVTYTLRFSAKPLPLLAAEAAAALEIAPDVPLPELARFYVAHQPQAAADLTVADAVAAHLATRIKKGISKRWQGTLGSQLARFAAHFTGPLVAITAEQIDAWVLSLPNVSAVTRNNYLAAVQSLFNLPALAHAPHRAAILALDPCGDLKARGQTPRLDVLWTPDEFRQLLDAAARPFTVLDRRTGTNVPRDHRHLLPLLVLGGFGQMRNESEAMRARWENVHLGDRQIYANGKTGERLVTLPPNAVEWLRLCAKPSGPIWPWGEHKLHKDLRALAARCELEWRPNALRKSAVTYAMKLQPDAEAVSRAAGNSASVLRRYYLKLGGITKARARAWFAIRPAKDSRVIVPLRAATA